jgi:glycosyltransferase involved in cell wall biosynthesis
MRVLHVIPSVSAVHGGPSQAIVNMEKALSSRGVNVTTVTTNDDGNNRTLQVPCFQPIATPYATRWYFPCTTSFFKVSIGLGSWVHDNVAHFDVVHAHALFSFAPIAAAFYARRSRVPYVLHPLGVLSNYGMNQRRPLLKRISFAVIERNLLQHASAVHFTSSAEQAEADALGSNCNSVVIPLGIDVKVIKKVIPTQPSFNLLFLSRIDRKKNLEGVLQALRLVLAKGLEVTLNIAGDGDAKYVIALKLLARDLAITEHVNWLGYVEGEVKLGLLASASAFVLSSYSESFGIAVAEALAAGLPCLVSRGVALSSEIEKARAGIVTGTTSDEIAAGIERLLVQPGETSKMSEAAHMLALSSYSLNTMGERLEMLYRRIMETELQRRAALAS